MDRSVLQRVRNVSKLFKLSKLAIRRSKGMVANDVWKKGGRCREGGRDWSVYIESTIPHGNGQASAKRVLA